MKARLLTGINALIAFLLGVLGFSSCEPKLKYAMPYAELEATGKVTNERNEPIRSARVTLKNVPSRDGYTDADGIYSISVANHFPVDSLSILVSDTDGVYRPDSVRLKVDYDRSDAKQRGDSWYRGKGYVYQDFQLKEK